MFPHPGIKVYFKITSETRKFGLNSRRAQDGRFGSNADIATSQDDVRFTLESGHLLSN